MGKQQDRLRLDALVKGLSAEDEALVRNRVARLPLRVLLRAKTQTHLHLLMCRDCRGVFANRDKSCPKCKSTNVLRTRAVRWGPPSKRHLANYAGFGRLGGLKRTKSRSRAERLHWSAKGGQVRARKLSAQRRREIAAMGGRARHRLR